MLPNTPCRAVYAGSFDPPTLGHLWMIRQAQSMFDELIVAIGINPDKRNTYTVAERQDMLCAITDNFPNVRIEVFQNRFLVHYAREVDAGFIVRGIRSTSDYEYERSMRHINSDLRTRNIYRIPHAAARNRRSVVHYDQRTGPEGWMETVKRYVPPAVYQKMIAEHHNNNA